MKLLYDHALTAIFEAALILLLFSVSLIIFQKKRKKHIMKKYAMQAIFNQNLLESRLEIQEQILHQIGEEIHDNIGQLLSSTQMLLGVTERNLDIIPDTLKTAEQILGKAIHDLRSLSKSLHKERLLEFNITDNLKTEVGRINTSGTVVAEYFTSTSFLPLKPEAQLILFRIVQEALQNSLKHANAQRITIRTLFGNESITVTIDDDGNGMKSGDQTISGISITNMQHRTQLLGGTIAWKQMPQKGTRVFISLPVQQPFI